MSLVLKKLFKVVPRMSAADPEVLPKVRRAARAEDTRQACGVPCGAVAVFGSVLLLLGVPGTSAAQIASVEVSAVVVPMLDPVDFAQTLVPSAGRNLAPQDSRPLLPEDDRWIEAALPARPATVRARLHEKPRAAGGSAGLVLQVIVNYPGN